MNYTAKTRPPTPQPELFQLYEEEPGGGRPGSVSDPAPQERVQRHTAEHRVDVLPYVQILDAPVPQGGNQLVEALRHLRNSWSKCRDSCSWLLCSNTPSCACQRFVCK